MGVAERVGNEVMRRRAMLGEAQAIAAPLADAADALREHGFPAAALAISDRTEFGSSVLRGTFVGPAVADADRLESLTTYVLEFDLKDYTLKVSEDPFTAPSWRRPVSAKFDASGSEVPLPGTTPIADLYRVVEHKAAELAVDARPVSLPAPAPGR